MIETLRWKRGRLELIDQRLLPGKLVYVKCTTVKEVYDAIKKLKVRGAPAIGVAGAYGVYLGVKDKKFKSIESLIREIRKAADYLASSRPTAVNLSWALDRVYDSVSDAGSGSVEDIKKAVLREAGVICCEDKQICRDMGRKGAALIKKGSRILTHCNAGALATADYGTALGVMYSASKNIKKVYVDETRPVLQGARLTAWELTHAGINATLVCDNMAGHIMSKGMIDMVITGADRIASNGDAANKIGTYSLAVLADHHKIPFYIAAPFSTFDMSLKSGKEIPIEQRDPEEVRKIAGNCITVKDIDVFNPAFDVTPAAFVTGIITEKGIIRRPDAKKIKKMFKK